MLCRIYEKSREIRKSGKVWFQTLWEDNLWNRESPVWRVEFQLWRAALKELGINSVEDVWGKEDGLWSYLTGEWFQLKTPKNDIVSRWPEKRKWKFIRQALSGYDVSPLVRKKVRQGNLKKLSSLCSGVLISIGALEGCKSMDDALEMVKQHGENNNFGGQHAQSGRSACTIRPVSMLVLPRHIQIVNDSPQNQSIYHAKKLSAQLIRYGINIKVLPIVVLTHQESKWMGSFDKECPVLYIEDLISFINRFSENNMPVNADRKSAIDLAKKILNMNTTTENKVSSGTKNVLLSTSQIDIIADKIINDVPLPQPPQDIRATVLTKAAHNPKMPERLSLAQKATNGSSAKVLTGKNKDGRDYVKVIGSKDEAEAIRDGYQKDGKNTEPLKADHFTKGAWYFYIG